MKCELCLTLIEEFVEGSLVEREASRVEAHLSGCPACAEFYKEVKAEQEIYAHYERDIEVSPQLWAAIESRIKQERPQESPQASPGLLVRWRDSLATMFATPRLSPALAAVLVVMTVGLTAAVMTYLNTRDNRSEIARGNPPQVSITGAARRRSGGAAEIARKIYSAAGRTGARIEREEPAVEQPRVEPKSGEQKARGAAQRQGSSEPSPTELVREAEQKYIAAIAILSRDVNKKRSRMDPTIAARFDAALDGIDKAIAETRRAVRNNPDDPIALQYMLAAYSKKVDTLREMSRGTNSAADED